MYDDESQESKEKSSGRKVLQKSRFLDLALIKLDDHLIPKETSSVIGLPTTIASMQAFFVMARLSPAVWTTKALWPWAIF